MRSACRFEDIAACERELFVVGTGVFTPTTRLLHVEHLAVPSSDPVVSDYPRAVPSDRPTHLYPRPEPRPAPRARPAYIREVQTPCRPYIPKPYVLQPPIQTREERLARVERLMAWLQAEPWLFGTDQLDLIQQELTALRLEWPE